VSLVVTPSRFQVDPLLFKTLVRRQGLSVEQYDLELPQRYLADYAQQRRLPVLDLLRPLRSGGSKLYERNTAMWNDRGNQSLAAAIGGWLESCYGGQLAAAQSLNR
jgi:hypothetical protein